MSTSVYLRGGVPVTIAGTTANPTEVEVWHWGSGTIPQLPRGDGNVFSGGVCNWMRFENTGTGAIILSFTEADATAGVGISVAGPGSVEVPAECDRFYTKSAAAEAFVAVGTLRRG